MQRENEPLGWKSTPDVDGYLNTSPEGRYIHSVDVSVISCDFLFPSTRVES
jgi:hypothetical protein